MRGDRDSPVGLLDELGEVLARFVVSTPVDPNALKGSAGRKDVGRPFPASVLALVDRALTIGPLMRCATLAALAECVDSLGEAA